MRAHQWPRLVLLGQLLTTAGHSVQSGQRLFVMQHSHEVAEDMDRYLQAGREQLVDVQRAAAGRLDRQLQAEMHVLFLHAGLLGALRARDLQCTATVGRAGHYSRRCCEDSSTVSTDILHRMRAVGSCRAGR